MACHLAGVEGAVATCGTAFGIDHIKILRRIMRDETDGPQARVIFTFDGDAAGQKAAMRAFGEDQRFAAQTFVAVAPDGMDPCELRIAKGDAAVRALVDDAVPMFEFAVRTTIRRFDLDTAEGRVQAMKAVAPIIGSIRDTSLRPEYTRTVSGWLGIEVEQMAAEVKKAGRVRHDDAVDPSQRPAGTDEVPEPAPGEAASLPVPDLRDPVVFTERQLLQALIQYPGQFTDDTVDSLRPEEFVAPAHRAVLDGIRIAAPTARRASTAAWVAAVGEAAPLAVRSLVSELSVAPLPTRFDSSSGLPPQRYLDSLVVGVRDAQLGRLIARRDGVGAPRAERPRVRPHRPPGAHHGPAPPRARAGRPAREAVVMKVQWSGLRRPAVPADVAAAIPLEEHERLLAWAVEDGSGVTVVAGRHRLYAVTPGPDGPHLTLSQPWHLVDAGLWSGEDGSLRVTWVDGGRPARFVLTDPRAAARDAARAGAGLRGHLRGPRPRQPAHRPGGGPPGPHDPRAGQPGAARAGGPQHRPGGVRAGPRRPGPGARTGRPELTPGAAGPFSWRGPTFAIVAGRCCGDPVAAFPL